MGERAWDEELIKKLEKAGWDQISEQLTVPDAVPRSPSEAEPHCKMLVCTEDLAKKWCIMSREKQHSRRFLEEQNMKLFSLTRAVRWSALCWCYWMFKVTGTNWWWCVTVEWYTVKYNLLTFDLSVIPGFWGKTCSVNSVGIRNEEINIPPQIQSNLKSFRINSEEISLFVSPLSQINSFLVLISSSCCSSQSVVT